MAHDLATYDDSRAQWPRTRAIYKSPLLLVKQFMASNGRPVAAAVERDLVYTDTFFGTALPPSQRETAYLLAAMLNSSFASWFFLMTASTFGLWMRRLLLADVERLPVPGIERALRSEVGQRLVWLARHLKEKPPGSDDWRRLDESVFDLYGLDESDRIVARDGLFRATWQWKDGRSDSDQGADIEPPCRGLCAPVREGGRPLALGDEPTPNARRDL